MSGTNGGARPEASEPGVGGGTAGSGSGVEVLGRLESGAGQGRSPSLPSA